MTTFVEGTKILVAFQVKLFLSNKNKINILLQMSSTQYFYDKIDNETEKERF